MLTEEKKTYSNGFEAGTNPPKVENMALAISGGQTLDLVKACDIFYGNQTASKTIVEAIQAGVKAGSPHDSLNAVLKEVIRREEERLNPKPVIFEKPMEDKVNVRKLK